MDCCSLGCGVLAGTTPEWKYSAPLGSDAIKEWKLAVNWTDKGYDYRFYVPRATLADVTEVQVLRTEATDIPVTFDMLDPGGGASPFTIFTEDPGFDPTPNLLD